jgi:integrase
VKKIRFAREDNGRVRFLSAAEERRLLTHGSEPLRPIIITALNTGLRRSELLALTWDDVDFERGWMTVRAAYAKNGESRGVPINAMLTRT